MATPNRLCAHCGLRRPIELQMTVKAGPDITLLSCTGCESRTWLVDGEAVPVSAVLAAAAGDDSFVLEPGPRSVRKQASSPSPHRVL